LIRESRHAGMERMTTLAARVEQFIVDEDA
jgi:hypothetical protein